MTPRTAGTEGPREAGSPDSGAPGSSRTAGAAGSPAGAPRRCPPTDPAGPATRRPAGDGRASPRRPGRGGGLPRDFRLLWIGQTTSRLGSSVSAVALPLVAVATLGAGPLEAGMLAAASWLPWLLIGLPAGAWVDRLPRRPVMLACDAVSCTLFLSIPVAAWCGVLVIGHLLAVAFLSGISAVFFQTASYAYLPGLLPPDELARGNARLVGGESAANIAGPGVAGLLAQAASAVAGVLADAASFLVSAVLLTRIRTAEAPRPRADRTGLRREIADGLRFVAKDPYLRVLTAVGATGNLALTGYQSVLVVFLVRVVGVSPGAVGFLIAGMSAGGVIGAFGATRVTRRFGTAHGLLLCQLGTAPFGLLIPLAGPGWRLSFAVAGGAVVIAGVTAGNVIKGSFRQAYVPSHLLGRVIVSMQFLNYGTIPLSALAAGALGAALGVRPTIWITTGLLAVSGLILLIGPLRRRPDLPVRPEDETRPFTSFE
ncbi:MFS transporter [Microbispora sp. ATCC PTA-5024]|uniref:MFS transporter n=1 Tax=Microbispora sp. ATCC PTA-5024 TaxID=316330 RepID=UPI000A04F895|nr:MFS transporter [Microbispora sp. ATCC PTA-5024]